MLERARGKLDSQTGEVRTGSVRHRRRGVTDDHLRRYVRRVAARAPLGT